MKFIQDGSILDFLTEDKGLIWYILVHTGSMYTHSQDVLLQVTLYCTYPTRSYMRMIINDCDVRKG